MTVSVILWFHAGRKAPFWEVDCWNRVCVYRPTGKKGLAGSLDREPRRIAPNGLWAGSGRRSWSFLMDPLL